MEPHVPDQLLATLRYQAVRLAELKEQIADGIDRLAQGANPDEVLQHFVQVYGTLCFIHQDIVALLPTNAGAAN